MKLKLTRAIIDAIHSGELAKAKTEQDPVFGFAVPTACPGVPAEILIPRNTWADKASYDATAKKLAGPVPRQLQKVRRPCQFGSESRRAGWLVSSPKFIRSLTPTHSASQS